MRRAVVCLGTPFRGDDAVGPHVAEALRLNGVDPLDCGDEPTRLIDRLDGLDLLLVVDAVASGGTPGTRIRHDAGAEPLPRSLGLASSHAVGIGDALELARALGGGPARVVVHGVEGEAFGMGDPLTPAVAAQLPRVVEAVLDDLEA